jgi:hypothetical protein
MCWKMLVGRLEKTGFGIGICLYRLLGAAFFGWLRLWLSRAAGLKAFPKEPHPIYNLPIIRSFCPFFSLTFCLRFRPPD